MTGKQLWPVVLAALVSALVWQTDRLRGRIDAGRLLARVEARTIAAVRAGLSAPQLFDEHLAWLARAAALDPLEIGVPIARGTQFLLLRQPDAAIDAYREAARLEDRPEIQLNLGRAFWMRGSRQDAQAAFARAVRLDPRLRAQVPEGGLIEQAPQAAPRED